MQCQGTRVEECLQYPRCDLCFYCVSPLRSFSSLSPAYKGHLCLPGIIATSRGAGVASSLSTACAGVATGVDDNPQPATRYTTSKNKRRTEGW